MILVVGCLSFGYVLGRFVFPGPGVDDGRHRVSDRGPEPWYKAQPPPPKMLDLPNTPILPDPLDDADGAEEPSSVVAPPSGDADVARAYEEALPGEVHLPRIPAGTGEPPMFTPPDSGQEQPAWRRNAVAIADPGDKPMIAIVIDDLGVDRKRTNRIIGLPGPLTLSFLTYASDLASQARRGAKAGHELMLHVGMEPTGKAVDPGPDVLLTQAGKAEVRQRLIGVLDRLDGVVGINNHMGSRFTESGESMEIVLEELKKRGLLFLDSRTTPKTVGATVAHRLGVPVTERNVFLDNENVVDSVMTRLAETERIARKHGYAIAIGHPRDATIEALSVWLKDAAARGIAIVPISMVTDHILKRPT